jgi:hypothetical protein
MENGAASMIHTWDDNVVSDLHKDARRSRPGADWWARWRAMDADARQAEWDALCGELDQELARERLAEAAAQARWERHIDQLMAANRIDRATAIRWDMEAEDCGGDVGYYCYRWGIGYHNETAILAVFMERMAA